MMDFHARWIRVSTQSAESSRCERLLSCHGRNVGYWTDTALWREAENDPKLTVDKQLNPLKQTAIFCSMHSLQEYAT